MSTEAPNYVTAKEPAGILKTTKTAIYQRVYRKELPVKRLRHRLYFNSTEIEALLNGELVRIPEFAIELQGATTMMPSEPTRGTVKPGN